jgi:Ca2+-binding EF-hand superfamily protein
MGGSGSAADNAINKLRTKLASRGARGFIGIQKQFKIMDDNNSGTIDVREFKKAIKDFKVDLNDNEIQIVFLAFDRDGSGEIDYDEFVRGVRGPMNSFRKGIVMSAFKKIDKDGSGIIDINDIKGVYNASRHPEVKSGKKTEDEILGEFIETFEQHHSLNGGGVRDRRVTPEEFIEYYNNVSASIDND